jgi:hypothetical protein
MRVRIFALLALATFTTWLAAPAAGAGPVVTLDDRLAALSTDVPGFGGLSLDEEGRLNVFLKDVRQAGAFRAMDPDVRVHQADFEFARLHEWRLASRASVLAREDVVFLDVDETRNRLRIGVDRSAGRESVVGVLGALRRAGVPRDAVVIERTEPIHFVATLRDKIRPVPGGVQIRFSNFLCTLGYNATRGGIPGFVTASHCTDQQGGIRQPTEYFQPLNQVADEFIGVERVDPDYFRNQQGCPRGAKCRFSDSSWAEYDVASLSAGDQIARTTGINNGSLTIDPNNPSFSVTSKDASGNQLVGTVVNKVGRTTGWSQGPVSASCVDTGVQGSNIVLLCQDFVDAGVAGGDSGSNVFRVTGSGTVSVVGSLWGGNAAGTLFVYSPYSAVKAELGLD